MIIWVIIDGIAPHVLKEEKPPVFTWLAKNGAFTLKARTVYPSLTEPCFAAMMHSLDPVFFEAFFDNKPSYKMLPDFPKGIINIFEAIKPLKSSVVGTWQRFGDNVDFKHVTRDFTRKPVAHRIDEGVTEEAVKVIGERKDDLVIVYYENPDHVGHESGSGKKYRETLAQASLDLKNIIKAMDPSRDTLIVGSDHGRDTRLGGRHHSRYMDTVTAVPMFFYGRHIAVARGITDFVSNIDVAPTIMVLLGKSKNIPYEWRGKVIRQVFAKYKG